MLVKTVVKAGNTYLSRRRLTNRVRIYATDQKSPLPRWHDRTLASSEEPPVGAHLVSPRFGYLHHGIYLGDGKVIHSGAVSFLLPRGPVEEVSLQDFRRGRRLTVRCGVLTRYEAQEVVRRARSRLGEDRYRLLSNNCEHFCEWCVRGEQRSYQVERLMRWMRRLGMVRTPRTDRPAPKRSRTATRVSPLV